MALIWGFPIYEHNMRTAKNGSYIGFSPYISRKEIHFMTIKEAVTRFDTECKNNTPPILKLQWLSYIDSLIHREIILTHENPNPPVFSGYDCNTNEDTPLLVGEPYSELYIRYLIMKNDLYLSDISRYNNDAVLFASAYRDFENAYNKTHRALKLTAFFNA